MVDFRISCIFHRLLLVTQHPLIIEVVHGFRLLVISTSLGRLLLFLLCSDILLSNLVVVLESLGVPSLSFLLEVLNTVSILLNLLDKVAEFRGFEEP